MMEGNGDNEFQPRMNEESARGKKLLALVGWLRGLEPDSPVNSKDKTDKPTIKDSLVSLLEGFEAGEMEVIDVLGENYVDGYDSAGDPISIFEVACVQKVEEDEGDNDIVEPTFPIDPFSVNTDEEIEKFTTENPRLGVTGYFSNEDRLLRVMVRDLSSGRPEKGPFEIWLVPNGKLMKDIFYTREKADLRFHETNGDSSKEVFEQAGDTTKTHHFSFLGEIEIGGEKVKLFGGKPAMAEK